MSEIKSYEEVELILGGSKTAWEKLIGYIRFNYMMDEIWTKGKSTGKLSNYRDELKFRRGGKMLITLYVRENFFKVCIILGKDERTIFEKKQSEFSDAIRKLYDDTHTYHDGKWLGIDVFDMTFIDDIIRLLHIKRKPNRKVDYLTVNDKTSPCGVRCDLCLINVKNNQNGYTGSETFHEMDWHCYSYGSEKRIDYTKTVCQGCSSKTKDCKTLLCLNEKGVPNCMECGEYNICGKNGGIISPGRCNLGLNSDEVTNCVIPYCSKERMDYTRGNYKK